MYVYTLSNENICNCEHQWWGERVIKDDQAQHKERRKGGGQESRAYHAKDLPRSHELGRLH